MSLLSIETLAQTSTSSMGSVIVWSAVLLVILILAYGAYSRYKRWMNEVDTPAAAGFTFSDLRDLHRQGKLTTEEFEAARLRMVASAKRMTGSLPPPLADTRKTPVAGSLEPGPDKGL